LLHVTAAVSADFRLIVGTGSPENIHNNAADLIDTSPSDKVFITADGTRVRATCVGKLPLILTDTSGYQSFYILHEVHAIPSFEYTSSPSPTWSAAAPPSRSTRTASALSSPLQTSLPPRVLSLSAKRRTG